jgi:hypothetical protein
MKFVGLHRSVVIPVLLVAWIGPIWTESLSLPKGARSSNSNQHHQEVSRREWFELSTSSVAAAAAALTMSSTLLLSPQVADAATSEYVQELQTSKSKLQDIPNLLQEQEW